MKYIPLILTLLRSNMSPGVLLALGKGLAALVAEFRSDDPSYVALMGSIPEDMDAFLAISDGWDTEAEKADGLAAYDRLVAKVRVMAESVPVRG